MLKYLLILAISVLNANSAFAGWVDYPALYDVTGVAPDDVLNVREGQSASTPIINTLAPNQRNVEIVAVSNDERWGLVSFPEGSGWVSMRYMARQPGQDPQFLPKPLGCGGTEPFWGLSINNQTAQFDMMGESPRTYTPIWEDIPSGMQAVSYAVKMQGNGEDITAIISRNQCSDGMSDSVYGFRIDVILSGQSGNRYYTGCCSLN
ncbi:COG3650 family protein [Profundibacter amoris]|uniref:Peptide-binding protein n=1 Tax=Profundibacter amoris TaxID=2171755 RepID=A0A347UK74_9RHOB|nr:hypothetical protein [Profundibacter amoris]AXX99252.1 hypothetical protein BAR1_15725 [Profundibacter amoris]